MIHNIFIHSAPRSGSTWLQMVFQSHPKVLTRYQPFFAFEFKGRLEGLCMEKDKSGFQTLLNEICKSDNEFISMKASYHTKDGSSFPETCPGEEFEWRVFKQTHYHYCMKSILELDPECKMICIVRHPCGALNSVMQNKSEFCKEGGSDEWLTGAKKNEGKAENFFGYLKWKEFGEIALDLKAAYPDRVFLFDYDMALLTSPLDQLQEAFDFVGLDLSSQVKDFVASSHQSHDASTTAVYKSKSVVDRWKKELDPTIVSFIEKDLEGHVLDQFFSHFSVCGRKEASRLDLSWPDIYFTPSYGALVESPSKVWMVAYRLDGKILHVFLEVVNDDGSLSIETPYGYAGWWQGSSVSKDETLRFRKWFEAFGHYRGYTREFLRLNPYLGQASPFESSSLVYQRKTYGIFLESDYSTYFLSTSRKNQSTVRRALREGLKVSIENVTSGSLEPSSSFRKLYNQTMKGRDAREFYFFNDHYFATLETMKEVYLVKVVDVKGQISHIALFFLFGPLLHYHLSCSDRSLPYSYGFNLMFDRLAAWAIEKGVTLIHLGGGLEEHDGLAKAKASISNRSFPYYSFHSNKK